VKSNLRSIGNPPAIGNPQYIPISSSHPGKIGPDKMPKNYLVLPFVPDITHALEKVFKKYDIHIAYDSCGKLGDLLGNQKDKTPETERSGIYIIKCKKCDKFYIGQSKRRVGKRYDDHQGYITTCQLAKFGIADHENMTKI
jgi:hypothetical protein